MIYHDAMLVCLIPVALGVWLFWYEVYGEVADDNS